jgi:regulator of nucleoside diphosphate kinase
MTETTICVTQTDLQRLNELLDDPDLMRQRPYLETLAHRLKEATAVVSSDEVPDDVITMNSTARLVDRDSGEELTLTVVYPEAADIVNGKISVLAPVGMAILGERVGNTVTWEVPAGIRHLHIKEILYQPEAAGQPD